MMEIQRKIGIWMGMAAGMIGAVAGPAAGQPTLEPGGLFFLAEDTGGAPQLRFLQGGAGADMLISNVSLTDPRDLPPALGVDWFADRAVVPYADGSSMRTVVAFGGGSAEPVGIWGNSGTYLDVSLFMDAALGFDNPLAGYTDPTTPFVSSRLVSLWETTWLSFGDPAITFDGVDGEAFGGGLPVLQVQPDGLLVANLADENDEPIPVPGTDSLGPIVSATAFPPGSVSTNPRPDLPGHVPAMAMLVWDTVSPPVIYGIWGTGGVSFDGVDGEAIWGTTGTLFPITEGGLMTSPTAMAASWPDKQLSMPPSFLVADAGSFAGARGERGGTPARIIGVGPDGTQSVISEGNLLVNPRDIAPEAGGTLVVADPDAAGGDGALIRVDLETGAQTIVKQGGVDAGWVRPVAVGVARCSPPVYVVDSTGDTVDPNPGDGDPSDASGDVTLRSAVMEANASPCDGGAIVEVPAGDYLLSLAGPSQENGAASGDLDITGYVRIRGAGRTQTTIDASQIDRVFHVQPGAALVLADLEITGGDPSEGGGGGIRNEGSLSMSRVEVRQNSGPGGGGGLVSTDADSVIIDTRFAFNSSAGNGGAVLVSGSVGGTVSVARSLFQSNQGLNGGAIFGSRGTIEAVNCTLSGNDADFNAGGAGVNLATLGLDHCTVVFNSADQQVAGASGGGLAELGGTVEVRNSIVAANEVPTQSPQNGTGTITSLGYNVFDGVGGFTLAGDTGTVVVGDPMLNALADNGGPTMTHSISSQSPALDGGDPALTTGEDQRDVARPVDGDGDMTDRADIGAYEFVPPACPGDLDGDGDTDVFDFGLFASNFGSAVPFNEDGDLDGDGDVDVFDFGIFASNFGCVAI